MIEAVGLSASRGGRRILTGVTVSAPTGAFVTVSGPSGSGKSTLMNCLASLLSIDGGSLRVCGIDLTSPSARRRREFLRERSAFVFQSHNLVSWLTVEENVRVGLRYRPGPFDGDAVHRALDSVGLADRLLSRPAELSGGERQRVAIARAVVGRPSIVFADEPTGNLDVDTAAMVVHHLRAVTRAATLVVVTHDRSLASTGDLQWTVADRTVVERPMP